MPVHIEIRQAGIGIIINFSGALTLFDFYEVQDGFLTSTEKLKHVKYVILDLTLVDSLNIPYGDVELLGERSKLIADSGPPGVLHVPVCGKSFRNTPDGKSWCCVLVLRLRSGFASGHGRSSGWIFSGACPRSDDSV